MSDNIKNTHGQGLDVNQGDICLSNKEMYDVLCLEFIWFIIILNN